MGSKYKDSINSNPGPATYSASDVLTKTSSQQVTISHAERGEPQNKMQKDLPGPADYEDQTSTFGQTQNAPTMVSRHEERLNSNPGPGQYNADASAIQARVGVSVSIGQAERQELWAD